MDKVEIKRGEVENIDSIKPLWEKLRQPHYELSPYFKDRFRNMDWGGRKKALSDKSKEMLFEYAVDAANNHVIGYCISTIDSNDDKTGEIDSIYIDEQYRKSGIGKRFVENAVSWFASHNVETQKLLVGVGNEDVLNFYGQFDFYPVHIVLQKRKK
jgi:ribosomal protein S18 acetylase RimI-like enzyme